MKPLPIISSNKRGAELTLNTIIIAIIVLIVLVVMVLLFTGKIRKTSEGITDVERSIDVQKCEIPGARACVEAMACSRILTQYQASCPGGQVCCEYGDVRR